MPQAGLPKYEPCSNSLTPAPEQKRSGRFRRLLRRSLAASAAISAALGAAAYSYPRVVDGRRPLEALSDKPWAEPDREAFFQQYATGATTALSPDDQAVIALCTIDVWQAMGRLGSIGTILDATIDACQKEQNTARNRGKCSQAVSSVLTQVSLAAALLSSAASDCALSINVQARCSSNINGLIGNLAAATSAASGVYFSCNPTRRLSARESTPRSLRNATGVGPASHGLNIAAFMRQQAREKKLLKQLGAPSNASQIIDPNRPRSVAQCFFDVVQTTGFLARFSLTLRSSIQVCDPQALDKPDAQRKCAVTVLSLIGSFGLAGQFLSAAINDCTLGGNVDATCSRDVVGLIATLSSSAAFAGNVKAACDEPQEEGKDPDEDDIETERRLQPLELEHATGQD
mmetsp:Transcript_82273/g.241529  ORF Transcript_82273/g.241529 Transcript_82273/m.241529 type:complete len:402 (+) Transcript_82273:57-1262(+)